MYFIWAAPAPRPESGRGIRSLSRANSKDGLPAPPQQIRILGFKLGLGSMVIFVKENCETMSLLWVSNFREET